MEEIELIEKRKPREKHFLQKDGTIIAKVYDTDIHFLKDGKYEEIDNTLIKSGNVLVNRSNDFEVEFEEVLDNYLMKMKKDNNYLNIKLSECNHSKAVMKDSNSKLEQSVLYENVMDDISIEYKTLSNKVKETVVLKSNKHSKLNFIAETNLELTIENKCIIAMKNGERIFELEAPYMEDSEGKINNNIYYCLINHGNHYDIELVLDNNWLNSSDVKYPVYVDPTITSNKDKLNLYDTYIYPGDTNISRYNLGYLKAGVEKVNGQERINRTLIKFDLPTIGTGYEIVNAELNLIPYVGTNVSDYEHLVEVHRMTVDWTEENANWNTVSDKYDDRVESIAPFWRSTLSNNVLEAYPQSLYITGLVKQWYEDTPNYGIMIKACNETYTNDEYPMFFSKNNTVSGNPQPVFTLQYRNENGIEEYWDYKSQSFTNGQSFVNTHTGNLTAIFNLGNTVGGGMPASLDLVYNTNDVVLNNETFFGKGFRLNLEQTIDKVENGFQYLDENGTIHYFYKKGSSLLANDTGDTNLYYDEDGLNLMIEDLNTTLKMTDADSNEMTFTKIGDKYYLTLIKDVDDNTITINLNSNNSINKVIDKYNSEITIEYNNDNIIIHSPDATQTKLNYTNNQLVSLESIMGTTVVSCNNNSIITSIVDVNGLKTEYEYYEKAPYKIKKIIEYGLNNTLGRFFSMEYSIYETTITDNKGIVEIIAFNDYGNAKSKSVLKGKDEINDAYSIEKSYDNRNKLTSDMIASRYINNLLKNVSFESDDNFFTVDQNVLTSFDTENVNSGARSLRVESLAPGKSIEQSIAIKKGEYYTFSTYLKNNVPVELSLSYEDINGHEVISNEQVQKNEEFEREDVTIFYEENAISDLKIRINLLETGIVYLDNIQLEKGEVANSFNIIENSDFKDGLDGWTCTANMNENELNPKDYIEVVNINDNTKALKVKMKYNVNTIVSKKYDIKGKKGDSYTLSFWYKNHSVIPYAPSVGSNISIFYEPYNDDFGHCILSETLPITNGNAWQHFEYTEKSIEDFKSILIKFDNYGSGNDFQVTNISFYKNVTRGEYEYDNKGNLTLATDQSNNVNKFKYDKNNKLISMTNTIGKEFKYEYDNDRTDRVLNAISSSGISNRVIYDKNGNPVTTKISKKYKKDLIDGLYKIRNKGTNKFLKAELNMVLVEENECSNTIWKLEKNGDYFKIIYAINPEYSISYRNGSITLDTEDTNNLFQFEKNTDSLNGTYYIKYNEPTTEGATNVRFLTVDGTNVEANIFSEQSSNIEFYIELKEDIFIENDAKYTEDGRFLTKVIDSGLSEIIYDTDLDTGLLNSVTDSSGYKIKYNYNDRGQIVSVSQGNKSIKYEYNDKNLISKISQDNREYNFSYDGFLNAKEVKVGNNITYVTKEYENNNGNLISVTYGNNQKLSYDYDKFDRIKTFHKMDDDYNYKYDNNGNLAKIVSKKHLEKCNYDVSDRLYRYKIDNFEMRYTYNSEDEVEKQMYRLDNTTHFVENEFNEDRFLTKSILDNDEINYSHDSLGRLINIKLGNNYNTNYGYMTIGKRTTEIINKLQNGNNEYKYKYDKLYNITQQFLNDKLTNEYSYDEHNELLQEKNYLLNQIINYKYDSYGNILSIETKKLDTGEIVKIDKYQYDNSDWLDQLTNYNGINISYDHIGNPTEIGTNIKMTWINGRELQSYSDSKNGLNVNFEYNANGIRTSKIVNGIKTKYHLEENNIIYEEIGNDLIYYLYDYTGIIGLIRNGEKFYYVKNVQGDIVGILNENSEQIVTYEYDIWGKIIGIRDINGNLITDSNNIGQINPFRYRGYYYDRETELYYLNSRYYNPEWKRFLNPDTMICANSDLVSLNLYTYVSNNPVIFSDPSGHGLWSKIYKKAKKVAKKVAKAVVKTVTTVAKTVTNVVTSIPKVVGQIFSFNVGGSYETIEKSYGLTNIVTLDSGVSHSASAPLFGNRNSLIQVTGGGGDVELALNLHFVKLKISGGSDGASISGGFRGTDNTVYNGVLGIKNCKLFAGYQTDNETDKGTHSNFGRLSVNGVLVASVIMAVASGPINITVPSFQTIGKFAFNF